MSDLREKIMLEGVKRYGINGLNKDFTDHIISMVLDEVTEGINQEKDAEQSSPQPDEGYLAGIHDALDVAERLKGKDK